jgi:hypothetical protein
VRDKQVIWVRRELKYFCKEDWTASISLIRFSKFRSTCRTNSAPKGNLAPQSEYQSGWPYRKTLQALARFQRWAGAALAPCVAYGISGGELGGVND